MSAKSSAAATWRANSAQRCFCTTCAARSPIACCCSGLGKERDFRDKEFRSAIKSVVKLLNETGSYEAVVYITEEKVKRREVAWRIEHAVVVAMEAVYRFDQMKSEKSEVRRPLRKLTLSVPQRSDLTRRARRSRGARARHRARDGPRARPRQPARQRLHAELSRRARARAGAEFPDIKVTRARTKGNRGARHGLVPVRHQRQRRAAAVHRVRVSRQPRSRSRSCWSARASRSTPAASRSSPPATWTR